VHAHNTSIDWKSWSWLKLTWVLCFYMSTDSMNQADSINWFTDFWLVNHFKIIVDVTIKFKFFHSILQISLDSNLWNADWLFAFETIDFNVLKFNENIN